MGVLVFLFTSYLLVTLSNSLSLSLSHSLSLSPSLPSPPPPIHCFLLSSLFHWYNYPIIFIQSSMECSIPACSSEPIPPQQQTFHHQQSSVQMLPRLNGDNSVVMQGCGRSSNLQYPTAASNLKQFVSNTPLYVYQSPMFMNQQMPMWQ